MPDDASDYVVGDAPPQQSLAPTFEFKAPSPGGSGGRGGGYPRVRSYEYRPETPGDRKEDVYVPIHRLAAVAWLFPDDMTAADILASEALVGADVHHELGMPAATVDGELSLMDHGRHAEVTQAEMRAWAADAQAAADDAGERAMVGPGEDGTDVCARCGDASETLCDHAEFSCPRCPQCASVADVDGAIEVL